MSVPATIAYSLAEEFKVNPEISKIALEKSANDAGKARDLLTKWTTVQKSTNSNVFGITFGFFDKNFLSGSIVHLFSDKREFIEDKEADTLIKSIASSSIITNDEGSTALSLTIKELCAKYDCKIWHKIKLFKKESESSLITIYNHNKNLSVIVETSASTDIAKNSDKFKQFSFDCAMHIAAWAPIGLDQNQVRNSDQSLAVKAAIEKQLFKENKLVNVWPDVINGKIDKWSKKFSLMTQPFVKNDKITVADHISNLQKDINAEIKVIRFERFSS